MRRETQNPVGSEICSPIFAKEAKERKKASSAQRTESKRKPQLPTFSARGVGRPQIAGCREEKPNAETKVGNDSVYSPWLKRTKPNSSTSAKSVGNARNVEDVDVDVVDGNADSTTAFRFAPEAEYCCCSDFAVTTTFVDDSDFDRRQRQSLKMRKSDSYIYIEKSLFPISSAFLSSDPFGCDKSHRAKQAKGEGKKPSAHLMCRPRVVRKASSSQQLPPLETSALLKRRLCENEENESKKRLFI